MFRSIELFSFVHMEKSAKFCISFALLISDEFASWAKSCIRHRAACCKFRVQCGDEVHVCIFKSNSTPSCLQCTVTSETAGNRGALSTAHGGDRSSNRVENQHRSVGLRVACSVITTTHDENGLAARPWLVDRSSSIAMINFCSF